MRRSRLALLSIFLSATTAWTPASHPVALGAAPAGTPTAKAKVRTPIPGSAQELKQELKDMRKVARAGNSDRLRAMVMDLEIPDHRAWYLANFGESGLGTAERYEKYLTEAEEQFENQMIEFAREDGYFSVKKQNAKQAYPKLITSREVFLATWGKIEYPDYPYETPIGYFFFIDGKFRWDSTVMWVEVSWAGCPILCASKGWGLCFGRFVRLRKDCPAGALVGRAETVTAKCHVVGTSPRRCRS